MNKIILVFYINVGNRSTFSAREHLRSVRDNMLKDDPNIIQYILPTRDSIDRIECVNPVLLKGDEYEVVRTKLEEMNKQLKKFLNDVKDKSDN